MSAYEELLPEQLARRCRAESLGITTTEELADVDGPIGQPRVEAALDFALGIQDDGYHVFALGRSGVGRRFIINCFLREQSKNAPVPSDWCYVYDFDNHHTPRALELPAGRGRELADHMDELIDDLKPSLTAAFNSEEYQTRRALIDEQFNQNPQQALQTLRDHAQEKGFAMLRSPVGVMFAPTKNDKVMSKEEYEALSDEDKKRIEDETEKLEQEVKQITEQVPAWERERKDQLRALNREVTSGAVSRMIGRLRELYAQIPQVIKHLDAVEEDVIANAEGFLGEDNAGPGQSIGGDGGDSLMGLRLSGRYRVNVMVDNADATAAPLCLEDHPSYQNLVGRIEHASQMGTLVTDFRFIRPGALHRANGGYLLLDARKLLTQPFAWEGLKRALRTKEIKIESLGEALGLVSTISLEPAPIPLDIKIVLYGEPMLYYLLSSLDPEFNELFKVSADFASDIARSTDTERQLARQIATMARQHHLRPLHVGGVAGVIDELARIGGDADRLSIHAAEIIDLVRESDYFAAQEGNDYITADHVNDAVDAREFRADRIRERMYEEIERGTIRIQTRGAAVGQINGLSVIQLGRFEFGRPARISAQIRLGKGNIIDIEREVELGGPTHSKGVLILSGFVGARFGHKRPLAFSASLVFEQSYSGVDGDSASAAEALALLSAIAEVPLNQERAITGSIDQKGGIQAIGGVNQKIEGFFDICNQRALTGNQGVIIPRSNVDHLMLRRDVIDAVSAGRFHIWAVSNIDDAIELLTDMPAGAADSDGNYPADTFNQRVDARLGQLAETMASFGRREEDGPHA